MSGSTTGCPPGGGGTGQTASYTPQRSMGPKLSPVPGSRNPDLSKQRSVWVLLEVPHKEQALGCDAPGLGGQHSLGQVSFL